MAERRASAPPFAADARRVEAYASRGDNYSACRVMERAAKGGGSPLAYVYLARLTWKADRGGALEHLGRALALDPGCGFASCFRGELLRRSGRLEEALADLNRGLSLPTTDSRAYLWRAKTLLGLGRRGEAFSDYRRALELDPRRARSRADLGHALELSGDHAGAEKEYSLALRGEKSGPRDVPDAIETAESKDEMLAWLHFRRFLARVKAGKLAAGLKDLDAAHALDPKYVWDGRAESGDGLEGGTLERLLEREPRNASLRAWSGYSLIASGRFAEAEAELDRALGSGARSARVYAWRAQARLRLGRDEPAWADARAALAREPRYPLLLGVLSELELRRGRHASAVSRARQAIRVYPHAAWAYGLLGEGLLGLGRPLQARAALDQALEWSPEYAEASRLRGLTFKGRAASRAALAELRAVAGRAR